MSDGEQRQLTTKDGCEECQGLNDWLKSARQAKSYMTSSASGYRPEKSRSRQYKEVLQQMESADNTERLARARLRMHEIEKHEGLTESNSREFSECMSINMRKGRDRA
jgi:hypothetical protein